MARKGHGRPVTLVNIGVYPDDGSTPCGSNEWNANRDTTGVIGFTKKTEAISSYNINITDSYVEVTNAGTIYTMSQVTTALSGTYYVSDTSTKSFAEGDLLYLVKASGVGTVTLKHQNGGAGAGKITTLSGGDLLLDVNIPRIFICRTIGANQEWIEYGGGVVADLGITTAKLAADAVTAAKIGDDVINSEHYADGSIDNAHIADDAIDSEHYADASIDLAHLASDSVDGSKIVDNAIDSEHYTDASIDLAHLAADSVDGSKIADDAIDSEHYTDASIDNAHLADDAVGVAELSATGTANSSSYLRGDNSWATISAGASASDNITVNSITKTLGTWILIGI